MPNLINVTYNQTGKSKSTNALGMREMQVRRLTDLCWMLQELFYMIHADIFRKLHTKYPTGGDLDFKQPYEAFKCSNFNIKYNP